MLERISRVATVEDAGTFQFYAVGYDAKLAQLQNLLAQHCKGQYAVFQPDERTPFAVKLPEGTYRAQVLQTVRHNIRYHLHLVDTGVVANNIDYASDMFFKLPQELATTPPLLRKLKLAGLQPFSLQEHPVTMNLVAATSKYWTDHATKVVSNLIERTKRGEVYVEIVGISRKDWKTLHGDLWVKTDAKHLKSVSEYLIDQKEAVANDFDAADIVRFDSAEGQSMLMQLSTLDPESYKIFRFPSFNDPDGGGITATVETTWWLKVLQLEMKKEKKTVIKSLEYALQEAQLLSEEENEFEPAPLTPLIKLDEVVRNRVVEVFSSPPPDLAPSPVDRSRSLDLPTGFGPPPQVSPRNVVNLEPKLEEGRRILNGLDAVVGGLAEEEMGPGGEIAPPNSYVSVRGRNMAPQSRLPGGLTQRNGLPEEADNTDLLLARYGDRGQRALHPRSKSLGRVTFNETREREVVEFDSDEPTSHTPRATGYRPAGYYQQVTKRNKRTQPTTTPSTSASNTKDIVDSIVARFDAKGDESEDGRMRRAQSIGGSRLPERNRSPSPVDRGRQADRSRPAGHRATLAQKFARASVDARTPDVSTFTARDSRPNPAPPNPESQVRFELAAFDSGYTSPAETRGRGKPQPPPVISNIPTVTPPPAETTPGHISPLCGTGRGRFARSFNQTLSGHASPTDSSGGLPSAQTGKSGSPVVHHMGANLAGSLNKPIGKPESLVLPNLENASVPGVSRLRGLQRLSNQSSPTSSPTLQFNIGDRTLSPRSESPAVQGYQASAYLPYQSSPTSVQPRVASPLTRDQTATYKSQAGPTFPPFHPTQSLTTAQRLQNSKSMTSAPSPTIPVTESRLGGIQNVTLPPHQTNHSVVLAQSPLAGRLRSSPSPRCTPSPTISGPRGMQTVYFPPYQAGENLTTAPPSLAGRSKDGESPRGTPSPTSGTRLATPPPSLAGIQLLRTSPSQIITKHQVSVPLTQPALREVTPDATRNSPVQDQAVLRRLDSTNTHEVIPMGGRGRMIALLKAALGERATPGVSGTLTISSQLITSGVGTTPNPPPMNQVGQVTVMDHNPPSVSLQARSGRPRSVEPCTQAIEGQNEHEGVYSQRTTQAPKLNESSNAASVPASLQRPSSNIRPGIEIIQLLNKPGPSNRTEAPILIEGALPPAPVNRLEDYNFDERLLNFLTRAKGGVVLNRSENYIWPAIGESRNLVVISSRQTGYTVPMLNMVLKGELYDNLKVIGPKILIICASWEDCDHAGKEIEFILGQHKYDLKFCYDLFGSPADENDYFSYAKRFDIQVATLPALMRLIRKGGDALCSLNRCSMVIFENLDTLADLYFEDLVEFLGVYADSKAKTGGNVPRQVIAFAHHWNKKIGDFVESTLSTPLTYFSKLVEAAVYGGVKFQPWLVEERRKMEKLVEILGTLSTSSKVVVFTREGHELVDQLVDEVRESGFPAVGANRLMGKANFDEVMEAWHVAVRDQSGLILVCNDAKWPDLVIKNADNIIHYDIDDDPKNQDFGRRMSASLEYFKSSSTQHVTSHILLSECSGLAILPRVIRLASRTGVAVEAATAYMAKEVLQVKEKIKDSNPLCTTLKKFGACRDIRKCEDRHFFHKESDTPLSGVVQGELTVLVKHVAAANVFYGIIRQFISVDGTEKANVEHERLAWDLINYFNGIGGQQWVNRAKVDQWYGYQYAREYVRVKVLKVLEEDALKRPTLVLVKFLDLGMERQIQATDLLELPERFQTVPPQAIEFICCEVKPLDKDRSFDYRVKDRIERQLSGSTVHGRIKLALGRTIWLSPAVKLVKTDGKYNRDLSVKQMLLRNNLAEENLSHLPALYGLCRTAGMELPDYSKIVERRRKQPEAAVDFLPREPQYPSAEVYVSQVTSPREFHVIRVDKYKALQKLEEDIEGWERIPLKSGYPGLYCLAKFPEDGLYYRAKILEKDDKNCKVFFVDHGETETLLLSDLCEISDSFLLRLPLQAISCRLAFIQPISGSEFPETAGDWLYSRSRDGDEMIPLAARVETREDDEYFIMLFDGDKNIVTEIVDAKEANWTRTGLVRKRIPGFNRVTVAGTIVPSAENIAVNLNVLDEEEPLELNWEDFECHVASEFQELVDNAEEIVKEVTAPAPPPVTVRDSLPPPLVLKEEIAPVAVIKEDYEGGQKPELKWGEKGDLVVMKIIIPDADCYPTEVRVEENVICFSCLTDAKLYTFGLTLFGRVKFVSEKSFSQRIEVTVEKAVKASWPRLTKSVAKHHWIRLDYEISADTDTSDSEDVVRTRIPYVSDSDNSDADSEGFEEEDEFLSDNEREALRAIKRS